MIIHPERTSWKRLAELKFANLNLIEYRISLTRVDIEDHFLKLPESHEEDQRDEMKSGGTPLPVLTSTVQKSLEVIESMGFKYERESFEKLKMRITNVNLETNFVHGSSLKLILKQRKFGELSEEMEKYWRTRLRLFSKFDQGIQMDDESWFSVTPEPLARHIAKRMRRLTVVDAFCGAGGNTIQFAMVCDKVIAIDIDPDKIRMARNNARIYGVEHKIVFINMDFLKFVPDSQTKVDAVFLSPPWGGPAYRNKDTFGLNEITPDIDRILAKAKSLSPNFALYLPRNTAVEGLLECSGGGHLEVEQNLLTGRLKTITVYFGNLVNRSLDPILSSSHSTYQWKNVADTRRVSVPEEPKKINFTRAAPGAPPDLRPVYVENTHGRPGCQTRQRRLKKFTSESALVVNRPTIRPKMFKNFTCYDLRKMAPRNLRPVDEDRLSLSPPSR